MLVASRGNSSQENSLQHNNRGIGGSEENENVDESLRDERFRSHRRSTDRQRSAGDDGNSSDHSHGVGKVLS